jgi:hypothetical protein
MTAFVVPNFQGLAPRFADRLLDASQSSFVANLKPGNGDLRGFRSLKPFAELTPSTVTYRRAIRFFKTGTEDYKFFKSEDVNACALKSPLAQDAFDRIYFTEAGSTGLRVTVWDDLDDDPATDVAAGVPRPVAAPTVTPPASGTPTGPRAYIYIYVNNFGSLGAPSPPTVASGPLVGTWVISGFSAAPSGIVYIDIYRAVSGEETSGDYYRVGRITAGTTTFNDNMNDTLLVLQPPLDSIDNDVPPADIQGLVQHSSGAFAAFHERTVYFSRPYLPEAWPGDYAYPVGDKIVGIAAILNYIIVLTKSQPYILAGDQPGTVSISKMPNIEPCTSFRSIVVMSNAVFFASTNGLCSISQTGLERPTNPLLTREEFVVYQPDVIMAAAYGSYYIAFYETGRGFSIALPPYEPVSFVPLDRYSGVTGVDTDARTGDLFIIQDARVSQFDMLADSRFATTWRSKEFINPKPVNLGAVQLLHKSKDATGAEERAILDAMTDYNDARWLVPGPLDAFDMYPIGGEAVFPDVATLDPVLNGLPPIQPLGGEPLYDLLAMSATDAMHFTLIADGVVRFTKVIADELVHSMPEGYKATRYYLELSGAAQTQRMIVAETRRECRDA